jgi:hypothetical protein
LRGSNRVSGFASWKLQFGESCAITIAPGALSRSRSAGALARRCRSPASVSASFEQVVKLNNYVVDIGTNLAHYREVRDRYVNKAAPSASTTIGVPQLARPGALFEVEAIAILPPSDQSTERPFHQDRER